MNKIHSVLSFVLLLTLSISIFAAPTRVVDLTISGVPTDSSVLYVAWTTPSPQSGCTLISYDIRTSPVPISNRNWANARQVSNEPVPTIPGIYVEMYIEGLTKNTLYYVGLKTRDSCSESSISNLDSYMTSNLTPERSISLNWGMPTNWMTLPVNDHTLEGVNVYVSSTPGGPYDLIPPIDVGYTLQTDVPGLPDDGNLYCMVLTAYGYDNRTLEPYESAYSPEVCK